MNDKHSIFFEQFRSRATKASSTIFIWMISLVIIWIIVIVPKNHEIKQNLIPSKNAYSEVNSSKIKSTETKRESQKTYESIKQSSEKVTFKLPGWDIPVKTIYAFPLWSFIMFLFLLFLHESRKTLLQLFSKGLKYYFIEQENRTDLQDISGVNPFWIFPFPQKKGFEVSSIEIKKAIGLSTNHNLRQKFVFFLHLSIILLQFHVLYMSFVASRYLNDGNLIWAYINVLSCLLSTIIIYRWYRFNYVPDQTPDENKTNKISRRQVIAELTIIGTSLVFFPIASFFSYRPTKNINNAPRFRTKKPSWFTTNLKPGFYINLKSEVIHQVTKKQIIRAVNHIAESNLDSVESFDALSKPPSQRPILNPNIAPKTMEEISLQYIKEKKINEASDILLNLVLHDVKYRLARAEKPNIRIYDLLAGICKRYKKDKLLAKLTELVKRSNNDALKRRLNAWESPKSNWNRKWDIENKKLTWAGVPM